MQAGVPVEAVLIQLTGRDAPGLTAELTHILAAHSVTILDVGQALVHEMLSLGFLIQQPADGSLPALRAALAQRAVELGLQARFTLVSADELRHWLHGLRQHHCIVTILGRSIAAHHLARVSAIIAAHGLNVHRIERLSHELAPELPASSACIELEASGSPWDELQLRADFLAAAQELSIDVAFQRESIFRRNRRLFAFDMDSTLIQGEVIDELARLAGVGEQVAQITEAAMRGELDFDASFTRRVALLKGLSEEKVRTVLYSIPLADGAERLIRTLRFLGYKTAILSGGFDFFALHLQQKLGIDFIHSNQLEMVGGAVTGRVTPPVVNGERKAALLAEIAQREGISLDQVVAVGDGANDIPMLTLAGMGIAYRAKPLVRQRADHSIASLGLDGLLYLIGVRDADIDPHELIREAPVAVPHSAC